MRAEGFGRDAQNYRPEACSTVLQTRLDQNCLHLRERFIQLRHFLAAAARVVGTTAAFAADHRRETFHDFARLKILL